MRNPELQAIAQDCLDGSTLQHTLKDGLLYFKNKLRLASDSSLKSGIIIHEFHRTPMGGHAGLLKTFLRISINFYWPGMKRMYVSLWLILMFVKR